MKTSSLLDDISSHDRQSQLSLTESRTRLADLRGMLHELGVKTGAPAPSDDVDVAVDWLNLEGRQGLSGAVERDRQYMGLGHIHSTTTGYDNSDDEEGSDGQ